MSKLFRLCLRHLLDTLRAFLQPKLICIIRHCVTFANAIDLYYSLRIHHFLTQLKDTLDLTVLPLTEVLSIHVFFFFCHLAVSSTLRSCLSQRSEHLCSKWSVCHRWSSVTLLEDIFACISASVCVLPSTLVPAYVCSHLTEAHGGRLTTSGNLARIHSISFFPLR